MHEFNGFEISRRNLLKVGGLGMGLALAPGLVAQQSAAAASVSNALWIPPKISGKTFNLKLSNSTKQIVKGALTKTYSYNGTGFWGPTLVLKKGDDVNINVTNGLTESTTTHWHGMHLPAEMDGGPMQEIVVGKTWSPHFKVMNNAATYWYHPHMHKTTQKQLALGAGGFIIVQDETEAALALPRTYGVDDIPLALGSRTLSAANQIGVKTIYGDTMLTNGVANAQVSLPAQFIRLRILNMEAERVYNLGVSDGRTFHVVTTDGGLVDRPVAVKRLLMSPGERYEILIDLSNDKVGTLLALRAFNKGLAFGYGGGEPAKTGGFGSLLNNIDFDVLKIKIAKPLASGITSLPTALAKNVFPTKSQATNSRTIAITDKGPGTPFTFDNKSYSMDYINQHVKLNATEIWTITNDQVFGHSFHIHDVQFKILSRSSGAIPAYEEGWKDTFSIQRNEKVSFIAKFADYASSTWPFMYHCHMANHEDGGLMGQFLVES
ncbi:MAG: multicopper oxidase domain-containing protein [Actinomycetes bacterium]